MNPLRFVPVMSALFGFAGSATWLIIFALEGQYGSVLLEPNAPLRLIELAVSGVGTFFCSAALAYGIYRAFGRAAA